MPVSCFIKDDVLTVECVGTYMPEDMVREFIAAIGDPACPNPVALLLDVRCSEVLATRPTEEIRRVAEFLAPFALRIGGRCAVVASSDVHFGLSRLGSIYAEGVGVKSVVFREMDDALAWLKSVPK